MGLWLKLSTLRKKFYFVLPYIFEKNIYIHGYDVHEAIFFICVMHDPRVGPIKPYSENELNLRKPFPYPHTQY